MEWASNTGLTFSLRPKAVSVSEELAPHVYALSVDAEGGVFLRFMSKSFELPSPLYALDDNLIARVARQYHAQPTQNLGVILSGVRGTGKSVTAKQLCNRLGLPVIVVSDKRTPNFAAFLSLIRQPVVVFIDEYEKLIGNTEFEHSLLSIMDGVHTEKQYARVFLLTMNSLFINENLIQRPSRVRYLVKFGDLKKDQVLTILKDRLYKDREQHLQKTLEHVMTLSMITVDIVCAIVDEVNTHNEDPSAFAACLNVQQQSWDRGYHHVNFYLVGDDTEKLLSEEGGSFAEFCNWNRFQFGHNIWHDDNKRLGVFKEAIDDHLAWVALSDPETREVDKKKLSKVRVELVPKRHRAFI
jgi:hypothetical protein